MRLSLRHIVFIASVILLFTFAAIAGYDLWKVLLWEWRGAMDPDALNYFYVARGLLSGLELYRDIYEAKPPGIFWLMSSSLLITGDQRFLSIASVIMYASLPLLLAGYAYRECVRTSVSAFRKLSVVGCALLIGVLLTLYLEERAGMLQTEAFGGYFGALYALSVGWRARSPSRKNIVVSSALLFLSLWMKEPFLLTTLAAALVLSRGWRSFFRLFVLPLLYAGCAYVSLLLAFGYFDAYMTIHLPAMFLGRVSHEVLDPVWLRWLAVRWLYGNTVTYFPSAPLFGYLLILLLCTSVLAHNEDRTWRTTGVALFGACIGALFLHYAYLLGNLLNVLLLGILPPGGLWVLELHTLPWVVVPFLFALALFLMHRWNVLAPVILTLVGLCLSSQAVGISVHTGNHFAFAFPFYVALLLLFLSYAASRDVRVPVVAVVCAMTLMVVAQYRTEEKHLSLLEQRSHFTYAEQRKNVDHLDTLLDACGLANFYSIGPWQQFAFAKHPHVGPMVILGYVDYLPEYHYLIQKTLQNIRDQASVLLVRSDTRALINAEMDPILRSIFTPGVPECARPFLPMRGYAIWFRKQQAADAVTGS